MLGLLAALAAAGCHAEPEILLLFDRSEKGDANAAVYVFEAGTTKDCVIHQAIFDPDDTSTDEYELAIFIDDDDVSALDLGVTQTGSAGSRGLHLELADAPLEFTVKLTDAGPVPVDCADDCNILEDGTSWARCFSQ